MIREWLQGEQPLWSDHWQANLLMLRYDTMVLRSVDT